MKWILPGLVLAAMTASALPALCQSARGTPAFYIVLDTRTKRCTVVDETPRTDTLTITVANDTIYPTREEAETAMKALASCKSQ
ncbi:hypothetical protein [Bradyrhizobium sp.]|uniref:hypothetical protein n=1 Tax=Bradyrhizobium sp. TaxID=376 RepID=UPI004037FB8A